MIELFITHFVAVDGPGSIHCGRLPEGLTIRVHRTPGQPRISDRHRLMCVRWNHCCGGLLNRILGAMDEE